MQLVDANIVAYALVQGEMTERARALWSEDGDWRAPHLLFSELANIFTQLLRHQAVPLEDVEAGLDSAARMVRTLEHEPAPSRVVEIADTLRITAYDAWYLACAESLGTPLVTADTRLLRAAPGITRPLAP